MPGTSRLGSILASHALGMDSAGATCTIPSHMIPTSGKAEKCSQAIRHKPSPTGRDSPEDCRCASSTTTQACKPSPIRRGRIQPANNMDNRWCRVNMGSRHVRVRDCIASPGRSNLPGPLGSRGGFRAGQNAEEETPCSGTTESTTFRGREMERRLFEYRTSGTMNKVEDVD